MCSCRAAGIQCSAWRHFWRAHTEAIAQAFQVEAGLFTVHLCRHRLPATSIRITVKFGELSDFVPPSVVTSREDFGLPVPGELFPLNSVPEAPFVVETTVEAIVVPIPSPALSFTVPIRETPSLGDCWSETSPSTVLYHWHWKSLFQISAGSGSAGLVLVSGWSVAFAASGWEVRSKIYMLA